MKSKLYAVLFLLTFLGAMIVLQCYSFFTIMSGSMAPVIKTGSIVIVEKDAEFQTGDIVTYTISNSFITHRISKQIDPDKYITKGDANISDDPSAIYKHQIIGKVVMKIPYLGYILIYLKQYFCLILIIFIIYLLEEKWRKKRKSC